MPALALGAHSVTDTLRGLAASLDQAGVGFLLQDQAHTTVMVNQSLCDLFDLGVPARKFEGQKDLLAPLMPKGFRARVEQITKEGRPQFADRIVSPKGKEYARDYLPLT